MLVKQISVFVENKRGKLADITRLLARYQIDISAISIADTTNFGVLRMIVDSPDKAFQTIHDAGYTVHTTEVIAAEVPDSPGGLNHVLEILDQENVNVEYVYSFLKTTAGSALILFKVEEAQNTMDVLMRHGIKVLTQEEINTL